MGIDNCGNLLSSCWKLTALPFLFHGRTVLLTTHTLRFSSRYKADTRYSVESVSTHDRIEHRAESCSELKEVDHLLDDMDVVAIDEGQFFPDLLSFADRVANSGRIVIIACLDADFLRAPFGDVCNLVPRAELITKLTAVCNRCTADAAFTLRTTNATQQELIGGAEMYEPVCRPCHLLCKFFCWSCVCCGLCSCCVFLLCNRFPRSNLCLVLLFLLSCFFKLRAELLFCKDCTPQNTLQKVRRQQLAALNEKKKKAARCIESGLQSMNVQEL